MAEKQAYGSIPVKHLENTRKPYEHQSEAMHCLDTMKGVLGSFSTMVVLPTGGGKTYTASNWLLRRAINERKKVLWIAHRHALLDQAAQSFEKYAFDDVLPQIESFTYRIVSGLPSHCPASSISPDDDLLIASKDSLRNEQVLTRWLDGCNELFFVVDEAHHAAAKTYRRLIDRVKTLVPRVAIIGLTATPFRTREDEQGILSQIFTDGIVNGRAARGKRGIAYQIGLQDLINQQILARPVMTTMETNQMFGTELNRSEIDRMTRLDRIPERVARKMVESAPRNKLIVKTYLDDQDKYGQTIVFAVNIDHAVSLGALFEKAGVASGYVTSHNPSDENLRTIEAFRAGDIQVIVNVDILTEGVDLPKTQSVFLTRPTSSTILMTQMVGRALRGAKAGGTPQANIVSFVDGWSERVAWANPTTLFVGDGAASDQSEEENARERSENDVRVIAFSKIEEFASILDDMVDTSVLERVPFIQRIPVGMYVFRYIEQGEAQDGEDALSGEAEGADVSCQVMVYDGGKPAYEAFIASLPQQVSSLGLDDVEYATDEQLERMVEYSRRHFFSDEAVPPYRDKDIESIIKYFVQFGEAPSYYEFDAIDRAHLDVGVIARTIYDEDMSPRVQAEYENELWNREDDNLLRLFFGEKRGFVHAVDVELRKLSNPELFAEPTGAAMVGVVPGGDASREAMSGEAAQGGAIPAEGVRVESVPAGVGAGRVGAEADLEQIDAEQAAPELPSAAPTVAGGEMAPGVRSGAPRGAGKSAPRPLELCRKDVHLNEEGCAALEAYKPAGFAVNAMTGRPIKKFGGKALVRQSNGRTVLFSDAFCVADADNNGNVRLFSYDCDGHSGWDNDAYTLLRVQDFAASYLQLEAAPSRDELIALAADPSSRLTITDIVLVEEEAGAGLGSHGERERVRAEVQEHAARAATEVAPADKPAAPTVAAPPAVPAVVVAVEPAAKPTATAAPAAKPAPAVAAPVAAKPAPAAVAPAAKPVPVAATAVPASGAVVRAAEGGAKAVAEGAPKRLSREEFLELDPLETEGRRGRFFSRSSSEPARVLRKGRHEYLYIRGIQIADWNNEDNTLRLYEYVNDGKVAVGWTSDQYKQSAIDFACRHLRIPKSESSVRKCVRDCPNKAKIIRVDAAVVRES